MNQLNSEPQPMDDSRNFLIDGLGGTADFGENILDRNDDGSTDFIDVTSVFESGLNFFGTTYNGFYINNNGNITFNGSMNTYTPFALTGDTDRPIIAPFFTDIDTRAGILSPSSEGNSTGSNLVYWDIDPGTNTVTITWDDVGEFSNGTTPNAFQLRLTDIGSSNFIIEFRYEDIQWHRGDARAGYSAANGINFSELPQSGTSDMLDLEATSNINEAGRFLFYVVNGNPNQIPIDINISSATVDENRSSGTVIGVLSTIDPDRNDTHTYTLLDDADGRFRIVDNQLQVADSTLLDFEANSTHTIDVRTTDAGGLSFTKTLTITIDDVNEAPTDIGLTNTSIDENSANSTIIGSLSTIDPDRDDTLTYTLLDDADGRFRIVDDRLQVANGALLNFEANSTHTVDVRTTDAGGLSFTKTLTITINDVNETPTDIGLTNASIDENSANGTIIGLISANDPDRAQSHSFTLIDNAGGRFAINNNNQLIVANGTLLDFEANSNHSITIRTRDAGGLSYEKTFTITVNDINEPDIEVTRATASKSSVSPGETLEIGWTVTNQGTANTTTNWVDAIYLSNDTLWDGSDRLIFTENGTSLGIGANYSRIKNLTIANSETLGRRYLVFVSDRNNTLHESNETNNLQVVPIDIVLPDLTVESLSTPTPTAKLGASVAVNWQVRNQGQGSALRGWNDRLYLSHDTTISNDDLLLLTQSVSTPLPPGETYTRTANVTLPLNPTLTNGTYYLLVATDSSSNQLETNENNNLGVAEIDLTIPSFPDLVVSNIQVPTDAFSGRGMEIAWTITNQGNSAVTGTWVDRVYLSDDATVGGDRLFGTFSFTGSLAVGQSIERRQTIDLPIDLVGERYVIVRTDADERVFEFANENNNTTVDDRAIAISPAPLPNLKVSEVNAPASAFSNQETVIEWTITNEGNATTDTSSWYDRLWLSLDRTLDSTDTYLGQALNSSYLNAGQSYRNQLTVRLPGRIDGNYYFLVQTDANNQVFEYNNEGDNFASGGPTDVNLTPPPDLQVTSVNAPAQAFSGEALTLTWTVANRGTGRNLETNWYDDIFMSADEILDSSDRFLGRRYQNGTLNVGDSYSGSQTVTLPIGISGDFFFLVRTDAGNAVFEHAFEENNTGHDPTATQVNLTPPPDLEVESVDAPAQATAGRALTLSYRVTNFGATSTPNSYWNDSFYLSTDNRLDLATDYRLGSQTHFGSLTPDGFYNNTATFTLPANLSGTYYAFVVTDSDNAVFELNNDNNVGLGDNPIAIQVEVTPPPDLAVDNVEVPTQATASHPLTFTYRVTNSSTTVTPDRAWLDTFYLSLDNQFDPGTDINLGSRTHQGILAPNSSYTNSVTFTLPNALSGTYYGFVVTDSVNAIVELNNNNNIGLGNNPITIIFRPADLVTSATIPSTAEAGKALRVEWTVTNQGTGDTAVSSWTDRVFLSTDTILGNGDDIALGSFVRADLLNAGDSYTRSEIFTIPFELVGQYNLFVVTDTNNNVFEADRENNNTTIRSLTITRQTPDLQVTQVTAPTNVLSGQDLTINWTVQNLGTNRTNQDYWYDNVYLSADTQISSDDIFLGNFYHSGALDPLAQYNASATFRLPIDLQGTYYALVRTDRDNRILETPLENNNDRATSGTTTISLSPTADLVVDSVDVPTTAISGQSVDVTWTVRNAGGSETGRNSWYEAFYLSRDRVFDRNTDTYLGYSSYQNNLAAGATYTKTQSFRIPQGLSGSFYLFAVTDGGNVVYERNGEGNNITDDSSPLQVTRPQSADLVVGTITIPIDGISGRNTTISYTVTNQGANPVKGVWTDTIYLSQDERWDVEDIFFGQAQNSSEIASGGSYSRTVTTALPGLVSGDYHVILRSDIRNQIPESNETNNIRASLERIDVDLDRLTLGTLVTGTLAQGQGVYYRVDVAAGETLRLNFDSASTNATNELYIRYGEVPSRSEFDQGFSQPFSPDQEIIIPNTRAGTYYVLAYGDSVPSPANYSLEAELLNFSLRSLGSTQGSNRGQVTVTLKGAKLTPNTTATLIGTDGTRKLASQLIWKDDTEIWATLDLQGLETGEYDVRVTNGVNTSVLEDSFTVTNGSVGQLSVSINAPSSLRPGQAGIVTVNYANRGETDIIAPLLTLIAEGANLRLPEQTESSGSSLQFLGISSQGPAGIIAPGVHGSFSLLFNPTAGVEGVNFSVSQASEEQTIDWSSLKEQTRPDIISNDAWDAIWENFTASVGDRFGNYQAMLADNASHLSQLGEYTHDAIRLLAFEFQQVSNSLIGSRFDGTLDRRFSTGIFGRGEVNDWDITASTDNNGDVTLDYGSSARLFTKQTDGSYQDQSGDRGIITREGGIYRLQEEDGTRIAFRLDGKFDYIEDTNQNRITASYLDGKLTRLDHSNGNYFALTYNSQGLVNQTTDQDGWTTTYEYDTTGEYLLSITTPEGTTRYTYETNSTTGSQHAIKSITFSDNTGLFFEYDDRGRIIRQSLNGGAESVTYSYDSAGGVAVTDASGAVSKLLFNDFGTLGRIEDPLQRITRLQYDDEGNLTQLTTPDNTVSTFTYDNQNNLISSLNALGHQITYSYESTFNQLESVRDPRGNPLTYNYDNEGNLQRITYADGSTDTFSYDTVGNVSVAVNRRGQTIRYTYNAEGLLTRKDFADGTSATYTYDSQGNLLSAIDSDSNVSYIYDSADRLTRVTYDADRFLAFTYDSGGRRTQMVDQDGFTVNYTYNTLGRLRSLTDGTGANIITYTYDNIGRLSREDNGNGTYTTYRYDLAGQLLSLVNYESNGTVNSRFEYTYDRAGRRTSMTTLEGTTTYGYDAIGQLTLVTLPNGRIIEYRYDAAGNRLEVTDNDVETAYSTNNLNQYTIAGGAAYTYDTDGNLISKTQGSDTWTYTYDSENRLIGAVTPEGIWTYEYDALGNRVASIHNGQRTKYLLDPTNLGDVVGEYGSNGTIARYTHGLGLVSRVDGANSTSYYDADAIGSIIGLTGTGGSYLNQYSYLPFGESLNTVETVTNPFEYAGQWGIMREGNGLDFMRARFYDPLTGKFTSPDPLGIGAGDANLYRYVFNNPNTYTDPSGNLFFIPILIAAAIGAASGAATDAAIQGVSMLAGAQDEFSWSSVGVSAGLGAVGGGATAALRNTTKIASQVGKQFSHGIPDRAKKELIRGRPNPDYKEWVEKNPWIVDKNHPLGRLNGEFVDPKLHYKIDPHAHGGSVIGGGRVSPAGWGDKFPGWRQKLNRTPAWLVAGPTVGGAGGSLYRAFTDIIRPIDPNDIVGPAGFGEENWIAAGQTLPYTIRFENQATASAPAQQVTITHPLDADLDWRTFRLGSFGWGDLVFNVPDNRSFYNQRLDLTATHGFYVDVVARIDAAQGVSSWTLTTIDPNTGEIPEDATVGFLPPNNNNGAGDGFVTYTIRPQRDVPTGTVVDAEATIVFDTEEPIDTPVIFNTLDAGKPTSTVNPLPATVASGEFSVSWTGSDDSNGSALAYFTVYVSDNNGPFTPWLERTTLTEANYIGETGHSYAFYVVATDNAGNVQDTPTTAQASTRAVGGTQNRPPTLTVNQGLTLDEQGTTTVTNRQLQVTDIDNTAVQITYTLTDLPDNGTLSLNGTALRVNNPFTQADIDRNLLTYTHNGSETTRDSFTFTVSDGAGGEIGLTSSNITVNPVNDAPVAADDTATTSKNTPLTIAVRTLLGNDSDPEGNSLNLVSVINPNNGRVTLDDNGNVIFTPNADFVGEASFNYTIDDGNGGTDSASVRVTVTAPSDPPRELIGDEGNNILNGGTGNDTINGGEGKLDRLFGNAGDDSIADPDGILEARGEAGNDTIDVTFAPTWDNDSKSNNSPRSDGKITGGYGNDIITVTMNRASFFINLKGDEAVNSSSSVNNPQDGDDVITLRGIYGNSVVDLGGGNDTFNGGQRNDNISGGGGHDTIIGAVGNDRLLGGKGNDRLTGNSGFDYFIFDTATIFRADEIGIDTITDFSRADGDKIVLDKTTFQALTSAAQRLPGFSNANEFAVVSNDVSAAISQAAIVYNSSSSSLFYNPNRSESGLGNGGLFAIIADPSLTASDFIIQA